MPETGSGSSSAGSTDPSTSPPAQLIQNVGMPRSGLPPFPPFDPHSDRSTVGQRWRKWLRRFENLLISLREFDPVAKRGLLLTYVGEQANDVFDILPDTGVDYESAVKSFTDYFDPIRNKDMAIFDFREIRQEENESLNDFFKRLKIKAPDCDFGNADGEIKTQIIHKTRDSRLRKKALREQLTLQQILEYGNTLEKTDMHARKLEAAAVSGTSANFVAKSRHRPRSAQFTNTKPQERKHNNKSGQQCRNCGGSFPHKNGKDSCPAKGIKCHTCGKAGHFARLCLSGTPKTVRQITHIPQSPAPYLETSDEEFIFSINPTGKQPETSISIGGVAVKVIIDSGSSVNLLNNKVYKRIQEKNPAVKLQASNAQIHAYNTDVPLELLGQITAHVSSTQGKSTTTTFYITKSQSKCLLSCDSSTALGLLQININSVSIAHHDADVSKILQRHQKLFQGTGNLKNREVKLEIDESITPVAQPARRIPHSLKSKVNAKLQEMKEQGIIEKVEGATPWLSPMIAIPKKSGDIRLVLDMRVPNIALIRRRVQMPTVDEILQKMQGAKIFTEVDLSQGYLQVTLAEESRYITAFPTPDDGPHRFKRLIMGACPSGEYFHEEIHNLIRNVPDCANISDNIWLWSKDRQSHLQQLDRLLATLENSGITLKLPKCSFAVPKINVFGHIVSANGVQPDETKVEAVNKAPPPKSASEVRSFLGLTNYCSRYIADYSSITHPLRQLTRAETPFKWKEEHEQAFQQLKQALTSSPVLAHYSLTAPTRVVVDASPWAVGAVLLQQQEDSTYRPIAYGSRALSETERKYAQIEKESLAIVFGCEHFHMYLYGRPFELETDHRPLEHIYKAKASNPGKPPPARIERWKLRLQEYDFKVVYRPGANNLADSLSRLPTPAPRSNMEACADRYVHYLARELTPQAMDTAEVQQVSRDDAELNQIRECIASNQLHKLPASYRQIAKEISITPEDVVLRGNRIVLPTELRARAIALAHEDHAGMTRCKQRLRSKLWWPHMDQEVENHIQRCHPCQVTSRPPRPEPMQPTDLPEERWTHLAIDVCGPFPTGESVVVLTDYYSRWPEAKILTSVTSATILRWLDSVFAVHGYPEQIKSDNVPYFTSREFRDTLKSWGIEPKTVTEYWPQANGQVE